MLYRASLLRCKGYIRLSKPDNFRHCVTRSRQDISRFPDAISIALLIVMAFRVDITLVFCLASAMELNILLASSTSSKAERMSFKTSDSVCVLTALNPGSSVVILLVFEILCKSNH